MEIKPTRREFVASTAGLLLGARTLSSQEPATASFRNGVVVSVSAEASETGLAILERGGNAVDAAVATAFALAVTFPEAGNIGGGGFMHVAPGPRQTPVVFDYRETAPAAATKTMYLPTDTVRNHKAVGVPGTVRGLALAHQRFGKLPWKALVAPAVKLAAEGFAINASLAASLQRVLDGSPEFREMRRVLGRPDGAAWKAGDRLAQPELSATLQLIAEQGPAAFYQGPIADQIVAEMRAGGGLISRSDLAGYEAKERVPIHGTYRGYDVYGPPPPSSGGICLIEMLNILENFELRAHERFSAETLHLMAEAMRRAYVDRARHLGDPDFTKIPRHLIDKAYARELAGTIDPRKATPSAALAKEIPLASESGNTTHFSIIDRNGMAVANTYTLEESYGSRVMVAGAGFLLNNEMGDFNWFPGVTDRRGRIGTEPNQVAPGKRMLSSMTPTLVCRDGRVVLVTGSPGGRTIINTVLCLLVNVLDYELTLQAAVDAPRLHQQWFPDELRFEGLEKYPDAVGQLQGMGHLLRAAKQGDAHSIQVDPRTGAYVGAADRRISGKVAGF
jgi:gamma-glutamyltranspeptidase/glutathione hydrolase